MDGLRNIWRATGGRLAVRRDLDLIRHLLLTLEGEVKYLETEAIEVEARFKENYKDYEGAWNGRVYVP